MNDKTSLSLPLVFEKRQHERCRPDEVGATNSDNQTTNTTSFLKTCFNGLNALSGVGILTVPYAVSSGGWLSLLIQRCMDEDSTIRTYPDIGEHSFGKKGRIVLSIFMNTELYLVSTAFLILEGDNLHNLFPNIELQVSGFIIGGKECFIIIAALIVLPTVWLDNLSLLSYVSASGVFASAIILGSIFWTGAFDGIGFHQEGSVPLNWNGIPTSVSLYAFCYCAHPVFPTLYTSMKNKRQFSNVSTN
ncbi:vacuolar amino acid transporter 1 [Prunus yedoensis var. nudiflora]|uniref:Vacuolar amino acid transporter 1 n=1 Tax=Prunus yedoensis var. nudiflora TaxID=2094558 RepID=A0A314UJS7_PRUYE|nr:vacuolar amino acid transporter 1 [Prunus yedoensis var. nudiflora]